MIKEILTGVGAIGLLVGGFFVGHQQAPTPIQSFGSYSPSGGGTYRIGQSLGTTDTTIKLSSFKEPVSNIPYTMSYLNSDIVYGTLSPQSSISEFISATGITQNSDGSATLTGVVRGLTRTPQGNFCTASTTLATSHAGQSIFILSNSPCFQAEYLPLRSVATSTAATVISSTTPWHYDFTPSAAQYTGTSLVSYATLLATAIQGAATSTFANMGIVQLASRTQIASGQASSTVAGTIGAPFVIPSIFATSTPQVGLANNTLPVTDTNGFLAEQFFGSTTAYKYSFGVATSTWFGVTTLNFNGWPLTFNGSNTASSTSVLSDGAGNLSLGTPPTRLATTSTADFGTVNAYATSTVQLGIPAGFITASSSIEVKLNTNCALASGSASCTFYLRTSTGITLGSYTQTCVTAACNSSGSYTFTVIPNNSTSAEVTLTTGGNADNSNKAVFVGGSSESASTVNMANAFTLVLVAQGADANTTPIVYNFSIVVNK